MTPKHKNPALIALALAIFIPLMFLSKCRSGVPRGNTGSSDAASGNTALLVIVVIVLVGALVWARIYINKSKP